jgi:hypothetical protein
MKNAHRFVASVLVVLVSAVAAEGQNGKAADLRSANPDGPVLRAFVSHTAEVDTVAVRAVSTPAVHYGIGIEGVGGYTGVYGEGDVGVYGIAQDGDNIFGVYGEASNGLFTIAVRGVALASAVGQTAYGVHGYASGGSAQYAVYADGNLAYTGSLIGPASDLRLKEGLVTADGALAKLLELEVVRFTYRTTPEAAALHLPEGSRIGFVAQQVAEVLPELVVDVVHPPVVDRKQPGTVGAAEPPLDQPLVYKGIETIEMIPLLVKALQEQQAEIDALREQIAPLRHRLAGLESGVCEPPATIAAAR